MSCRPTPAEVRKFKNDGYLILPHQILPPEKFERLQAYSETLFADATIPDKRPTALIDCPHWHDPVLFDWIAAPEMLDLVEPLIGPDIAIFASHFLRKPPAAGHRVPWHEDSAYWQKILDPMVVASVTIALTPATPENGCLRVIPGSQTNGYSSYSEVTGDQVFGLEILSEQMDESKAVDIVLETGQASVHAGRIIHGSSPNTGAMGRSCLTVRYFPTTTKFDRTQWMNSNFHVFLARSRDQAGNDYSDPCNARGELVGTTA